MEIDELKKKSAQLLTKTIACAGINVFAFLATACYVLLNKQRLDNSGIQQLDPSLYETQNSAITLFAIFGMLIALLPIVVCIYFVRKRAQVQQDIQRIELQAVDIELLKKSSDQD